MDNNLRRRLYNVDLLLAHRLRHWANIKLTFCTRTAIAGYYGFQESLFTEERRGYRGGNALSHVSD